MFSLVSNCNEIISLDHEHQWKTVGILCENRRQTAVKKLQKIIIIIIIVIIIIVVDIVIIIIIIIIITILRTTPRNVNS